MGKDGEGKNGEDDEPENPDDQDDDESDEDEDDDPVVSMTQAKYDKLLAKKAAQGQRAAKKQFLTDLGVDNLDELKAVLTSVAQAADDDKTDQEKLTDDNTSLKGQLETSQQEVEKLNQLVVDGAIKQAIIEAAREAGAQHPQDVVTMALTLNGDAELFEDGVVDTEAIGELVEEVKKQRETWFGEVVPPQGNPPHEKGRAGNQDDAAKQKTALANALRRTKDGWG